MDNDSKKTDLLKLLRTEPLPALLLVGFIVASAVITLGVQVFGVYDKSYDSQLKALKSEHNAKLEVTKALASKFEEQAKEWRMSYDSIKGEFNELLNSSPLDEQTQQLRKRIEDSRNRLFIISQENEILKLKNEQLKLEKSRPGEEKLSKILHDAQNKISKLENVHIVTFKIQTSSTGQGKDSNDLISITFSNESLFPTKGINLHEIIIDEFTFSGRQAKSNKLFEFSRKVKDLSFLKAKYITVSNHGADGWAGESLKIYLDNNEVLSESLYPRIGKNPNGGIEKFNKDDWSGMNLWQAELDKIVKKANLVLDSQ